MKSWLKSTLLAGTSILALGTFGIAGYVFLEGRAFDRSMDVVYDIPLTEVVRSTDPAVLARGKHLGESLIACASCHGKDLAGGEVHEVGPVMSYAPPNITSAGLGAVYTDAELFRLLRHGVKKDGRSARMMPSHEFNWLPDADFVAVISWVRTMPPVERANGNMSIRAFGKVLDRRGAIPIDIARRIDHARIEIAPAPSQTAEYGKFVARLCTGCHGPTLSGGRIPGTPPSMPAPLNLTPHATGLAGWTYEDFVQVLSTGIRKDGRNLGDFMPFKTYAKLDDTEKRALFAYLSTLPPKPFGGR